MFFLGRKADTATVELYDCLALDIRETIKLVCILIVYIIVILRTQYVLCQCVIIIDLLYPVVLILRPHMQSLLINGVCTMCWYQYHGLGAALRLHHRGRETTNIMLFETTSLS